MKSVLYHDNLDDRKEMWKLLSHPAMDDRRRLEFVRWCAKSTGDSLVSNAVVAQDGVYTASIAWNDFWCLAFQHRLDIDRALARLVQLVRRNS